MHDKLLCPTTIVYMTFFHGSRSQGSFAYVKPPSALTPRFSFVRHTAIRHTRESPRKPEVESHTASPFFPREQTNYAQQDTRSSIMSDPEGNIGELLHSPSAAFMKLVDCDHLNDFDAVCEYLSEHAAEVSYNKWELFFRS